MIEKKSCITFMLQAVLNDYENSPFFKARKIKSVKLFDRVKRFDNMNAQGYFGYLDATPDTLYVMYRGSDEWMDWSGYNFRFFQEKFQENVNGKPITPYEGINEDIKISEGFRDYYFLTRKMVLEEAAFFSKVVIAGHSLGSTAAQLCALDLQANGVIQSQNIHCLPFASPKIGNYAFRRSFRNRVPNCCIYYYGNDIVVRVPFKICGDYEHAPDVRRVAEPIFDFLPWHWITGLTGSALDHYPDTLLKGIESTLKGN